MWVIAGQTSTREALAARRARNEGRGEGKSETGDQVDADMADVRKCGRFGGGPDPEPRLDGGRYLDIYTEQGYKVNIPPV
jgi:hypothetical protein